MLLDQVWTALASETLQSYMPLWLDLASGAARGLQPHRDVAGEIADGFLAWVTIRLQPEEEISLSLMNKTPSLDHGGMELKPLSLDLNLIDAYKNARRRIAYERLLLDLLAGNQTLFVRRRDMLCSSALVAFQKHMTRGKGR